MHTNTCQAINEFIKRFSIESEFGPLHLEIQASLFILIFQFREPIGVMKKKYGTFK